MDLQLKNKIALVTAPLRELVLPSARAWPARARPLLSTAVEKEFFATVRPSSLLKRFASIEEVASLVIFMASPLSAATNGAALRVDGGVIRSII